MADPTIGFGLTVTFGAGQVNTGVGLRVFSDDRRDKIVASVGLDYMFGSQSWRATVGPTYLGDNAYLSLDLGIGLSDGALGFGIGLGGVETTKAPAAPPAATPTPPAGPVAPPAGPVAPPAGPVAPPAGPVAPPAGPVAPPAGGLV